MRFIRKKIKVLDLFAGAGGFGLGFHLASPQFEIIASLEIDKWAADTLTANKTAGQKIIQKDIRQFKTAQQIRSACVRPDIIIGGPPCQGFSVAGPTKDSKDPRNTLFKYFAQWVQVRRPDVFVMENVRGLLSAKNEKGENVIDIIRTTFEKAGYRVTIWDLNAANYGVPQNRQRIFIVGNRFKKEISAPSITHYLPAEKAMLNGKAKTLKEAINVIKAIGDLPELRAGEGDEKSMYINDATTDYQRSCRKGAKDLHNHVTMIHTRRMVERYTQILAGCDVNELPEDLKVRKRSGNGELSVSEYNSNYRHLRPDMISYTIPASFYSNFIHPLQPRNITSREAARLQSFPDSYIFKGKRTQISAKLLKRLNKDSENHLSQYNQIGNAVPPLLAKAVASRIFEFMFEIKKQ